MLIYPIPNPMQYTFEILLDITVSKSQHPKTQPLQSILSFLISYPPLNPLQGGDFTNPLPGGVPRRDLSLGGMGHIALSSIQSRSHAARLRDLLDITVSKSQHLKTELSNLSCLSLSLR